MHYPFQIQLMFSGEDLMVLVTLFIFILVINRVNMKIALNVKLAMTQLFLSLVLRHV